MSLTSLYGNTLQLQAAQGSQLQQQYYAAITATGLPYNATPANPSPSSEELLLLLEEV